MHPQKIIIAVFFGVHGRPLFESKTLCLIKVKQVIGNQNSKSLFAIGYFVLSAHLSCFTSLLLPRVSRTLVVSRQFLVRDNLQAKIIDI